MIYNRHLKKLCFASLFLSIGLLLPFLSGQIPALGKMILPMHLPVIVAGFTLGGSYGLILGLGLPLIRSLMFGSPIMYPMALSMSLELATYGGVCGWIYCRLRPRKMALYTALISAMIVGRLVWGIAMIALLGIGDHGFTWNMFVMGAFIGAIPGILLQLVLVPLVVKLFENRSLC